MALTFSLSIILIFYSWEFRNFGTCIRPERRYFFGFEQRFCSDKKFRSAKCSGTRNRSWNFFQTAWTSRYKAAEMCRHTTNRFACHSTSTLRTNLLCILLYILPPPCIPSYLPSCMLLPYELFCFAFCFAILPAITLHTILCTILHIAFLHLSVLTFDQFVERKLADSSLVNYTGRDFDRRFVVYCSICVNSQNVMQLPSHRPNWELELAMSYVQIGLFVIEIWQDLYVCFVNGRVSIYYLQAKRKVRRNMDFKNSI